MQKKICTKCGREKDLSEFHLSKQGVHGRASHCKECKSTLSPEKKEFNKVKKELALIGLKTCSVCGLNKPIDIKGWSGATCPQCHAIKSKEYNNSHREERIAYDKKRNSNRKEYLKEKSKLYYENNRDKVRDIGKRWREKNPEKSNAIYSRYRKTEKRRKAGREWARRNREKSYEYRNDKYNNDTQYNLNVKIRRRIFQSLKQRRVSKSDKTIKLLGCSMQFFDEYIKGLFHDGMTSDDLLNGKIHIDHIIPVRAFDLTDTIQQRACFYFKNLYPLWDKDNLTKSGNYNIDDFNAYMDWFMKNVINK